MPTGSRNWEDASLLKSHVAYLLDFGMEVEKDVYALVSHFDMILNDTNVDWTGSEVPGNEDLLLDAQQEGHTDVPGKNSSDPEDPKPLPKSQKRVENNRKRKRDLEGDLVKTRRPRVAVVAGNSHMSSTNVVPPRPRR